MDCSSLYEVKEDGKVIKPMQYYETEDEIVETEETGDKTEQKTEAMRLGLLTFISLFNNDSDSLTHIAARLGHFNMARFHIHYVKSFYVEIESEVERTQILLQMKNDGKDTAIHEAVLYDHIYVNFVHHLLKVVRMEELPFMLQYFITMKRQVVKQLEKFRARCFRSIIYMEDCEARQNEHKSLISEIENSQESHLIVAALIATVTFVAGFTMPGGYNGNAILARKTAFQAFMIINPVAMVLSISAVFIRLSLVLQDGKTMFIVYFGSAQLVILFALGSMVIAFIIGTYAVLQHSPALVV
ncbi:hypothetical protein FEM48_Zijuj07G0112500 [Ziziphus jujuba var. spinosa]|uniref:PGG domain-containing protein n=1 Tax=Ziziphus jujuba var. spinosa TaxID=714518 RepID=A0A978V4B1_ZIZJJ|nr:hypothetical protein FEM48_Zijuj07G0112500 [Ziziphus jujuba var. spinosa]